MKELAEYFRSLRHNANFHLGLGDVRLTLAMQEEIIALANRVASQQMRAVDAATPCPYCKRIHDNRLACPEYAAITPHH